MQNLNRISTEMPDLDRIVYCDKCDYPLRGENCRNCQEVARAKRHAEEQAREQKIEALGGIRAYEDFTFDKLTETSGNAYALATARAFNPSKDCMYLFGPAGAGKTHIATAIARQSSCEVVKAADFGRMLRSASKMRDGDEGDVVIELMKNRVLVIDDLGASKESEFVLSGLLDLLDRFWMTRRGGLIITSNLSLDDLAKKMIDDRIPSRIAGLCRGKIISLVGEDDHRLA